MTAGPSDRHMAVWFEAARLAARLSRCPRRRFGCLILSPRDNLPLSVTYNGPPRGGPPSGLCGGAVCERTARGIRSGERVEVGCHHAEANAVALAARTGRSLEGTWAIVTGEPCLGCAKLLHHAGVVRVCVIDGGYAGENGVGYLREHGVEVVPYDGERDPGGR